MSTPRLANTVASWVGSLACTSAPFTEVLGGGDWPQVTVVPLTSPDDSTSGLIYCVCVASAGSGFTDSSTPTTTTPLARSALNTPSPSAGSLEPSTVLPQR